MKDKHELQEEIDRLLYDLNHTKGMLRNAEIKCFFLDKSITRLNDRLTNQLQINVVLINQKRSEV